MSKSNTPIALYYEEPDPDRWIKYDRYIRKIIRRIWRGKARPGGVMMVALELMKGLDKLNIPYKFNDYAYAKQNPNALIGVIGKPHLIFQKRFKNPILFGAGVFSHPIECPDFFIKYPNVKKMLVPGPWMQQMCEPYYADKVIAWPVGIDTAKWAPSNESKTIDFLIYDKVRWEHDKYQSSLIDPIVLTLEKNKLSYHFIKYGSYHPEELKEKLKVSNAVIFLCEHETQGIAYQQILATNTPILAWDRGGFWQDPSFYPHLVKYQPVSAVPYWDEECGEKFTNVSDFESILQLFLNRKNNNVYQPRLFIIKNLSLEVCSKKYANLFYQINEDITNS